jgi:hypothetical protein
MSLKRWQRERQPTPDEVVAAIAQTAEQLRAEADKSSRSRATMDEIAERLELLVTRLQDPDLT